MPNSTERQDTASYAVVVNQDEMYSIWPAGHEPPWGWSAVGKTGSKDECLAYIREVRFDARLRRPRTMSS